MSAEKIDDGGLDYGAILHAAFKGTAELVALTIACCAAIWLAATLWPSLASVILVACAVVAAAHFGLWRAVGVFALVYGVYVVWKIERMLRARAAKGGA